MAIDTTGADTITGTYLGRGATARWNYTAVIPLTTAQAAALFKGDAALPIRDSFHAEPSTGTRRDSDEPAVVNYNFCRQLTVQKTTGNAANVTLALTLPDGTVRTITKADVPALASIAPGASVAVAAAYTVPAPAARADSESDAAYLARLTALDGAVLGATATATVGATGIGAGPVGPVTVVEALPILSLAKTGPDKVDAGKTAAYDLTLANSGTAAATTLALTDSLPAGADVPVTDAPASLDSGASATAHATYDVPRSQAAGDLTDTATLTWTDAGGTRYGPISARYTTTIKPSHGVSHLTIQPQAAGPFVVGASHTLTVTATNESGQAVPNVPLILTIVGANPSTTTLTTDYAGQATFTYAGANAGVDTSQAAIADDLSMTSNTATASWVVPVIPVTTTTVHARFFPSTAVYTDDFTATPDMTPLWEQDFPNISFDPLPGKVKNDKSGINTSSRPFTDVTTDLAGNYTGTIVAQGNGYQAGVGDLISFNAVFTGQFVIAEAGDYQFDLLADDGYVFGIGGGATAVPGNVMYRCPASGLSFFEQYPVVGCFQHNTPPLANKAVVHFPAPGTYPYELDYLEVWSGSLSLNLTMHSTGLQVAPMGTVALSPQNPTVGQRGTPQIFTASVLGMDGQPMAGQSVSLNVSGANLLFRTETTNAQGLATFTYSGATPGTDSLQAMAYVGDYLVLSNIVTQTWSTAPPLPIVGGFSPADGSVITAPVDIKASFAPPAGTTISSWSVVYRAGNSTSDTALASGSGTPPDVLATFDPTVLTNGKYAISVSAITDTGVSQTSTFSLVVDGNLKLGRFGVAYKDIDVPMGGIPMQILRTYDSFDKSQGAFGTGWQLGVANFRVYTGNSLGEGGWTQVPTSCFMAGLGGGLCQMAWMSARAHFVTVVWPDGHTETFDFTPSGGSNLFWQGAAAFTGRPGTTSKLEAVGEQTLSYKGDGNLYPGLNGWTPYNPTQYKLTAKDGTAYVLDVVAGMISATDRTGNTVSVDSNGIHSSTGLNLLYMRDMSGRIVRILEPDGKSVAYDYSAAGDLVGVTDELGHTVTFEYDANHNLTKTIDPTGRPFETVTYGPDGRLSTVTDASGNTTNVTSDLATRSQRLIGPSGLMTTISSFNDDGDLVRVDVIADGRTATTAYEYDSNHNVIKRTDSAGKVWAATYDDARNLTSVTDANGNRVSVTYDTNGYPLTWKDPNGGTTTYHWSANGTLASMTDALGDDESYTYDSHGNELTRTDRAGNVWHYAYDGAGRLTSTTDPLGHTTSYGYDSAGRVTSTTDPLTHVTRYSYDAAGNVLTQTDPLGQVTAFTYDSLGFLATVTDAAGKVTTYGRDGAGRVITLTDATGAVSHTSYDADGHVATTTDAEGFVSTYAYDGFGNLASTRDPLGRTTSYSYDLRGLLSTTTNAAGGITHYTYDAAGNQLTTTDPNGRVYRSSYGPHGEAVTFTDPAGAVTRYTYDLLGRQTKITDPTGRASRTEYGPTGAVTAVTDPAGGVTRYGYDAAGRQSTVTDANGNVTTYGYDDAGRMTSVTDALGHASHSVFDAAGRITSYTSAAGRATTFSYDVRSLTTKITDALGHATSYTYDDAGRTLTTTDPRGFATTYTYDRRGLQKSMTDAQGHSVALGYDDAGQQISITDGNGKVWATAYDALGNVARATDPLGHVTTYVHDDTGLLRSKTDPRGITTTYGYDTAGRLASIATPTASINTSYDTAGRRTAMSDSVGTTTYAYDTAGRLASVAGPGTGAAYTYDAAGNRATMTAGGKTTTYTYDATERLATVAQAGLGTFGFAYDPDGELLTLTRPNGVTSTNSYDAAGRLTAVTYRNSGGDVIAAYGYTLDAAGNRTSASAGGESERYTIDSVGRLTGVTYADGAVVTFAYDAAGNRTTMTAGGATTSYTYDAASELTSAGSVAYTYDAAGNRLTAGSNSFTYDSFGNLASATSGAASIAYRTNGDGLRVSATSGGTTTAYTWDEAAGLPSLLSDGTNGYLSADTHLLAETAGSAGAYPLTDALGSVRAVSDSSGALTASASYGVYGDVRSSSGSVGSRGYIGGLSDGSGLVYLQARSLDPNSGTFTSRDPMTPGGPGVTGFNPYAYAAANPVTYTDPGGRELVGWTMGHAPIVLTVPAWLTVGRVIGGLIVLVAILAAAVACRAVGCTLPLPGQPAIPIPNIPEALRQALSVGANWTQGFLGEVRAALGILGLSPFLFLRYHVYFSTPLGARFLDICAYTSPLVPSRNAMFCVEVKTGSATRDKLQRAKDAWISTTCGFPIYEWNI